MWKFVWTNAIGIIFFTAALADLFIILLILATPVIMMVEPYEISWFTFIVCAVMAIGYPIAFFKSYKSIVADLRYVWRKRRKISLDDGCVCEKNALN